MVLRSISLFLYPALLAVVHAIYRYDEDVSVDLLCNENGIGVRLAFDEPFHGVIFPRAFDEEPTCRHLTLDNTKVSTFDLPARRCGTSSKDVNDAKILSNTIIVQWDASKQTTLDKAIDLSCKLENGMKELSAKVRDRISLANSPVESSFRFFTSKASDSERPIAYLGDKVGAEILIKDHSKQYRDVRVTNCIARENSSLVSIKLIDEVGCTTNPQLLSTFSAFASQDQDYDLIAVAEMMAFRFSDSNDVYVSCDVELCKTKCENVCDPSKRFSKRSLAEHQVHNAGKESEISSLMQQTVDVFSSRLLPKIKRQDLVLSKRSSYEDPLGEENATSVQDNMAEISLDQTGDRERSHEVAKLRVTASLAVLSSRGKEESVAEDCFPKWRLTLMTFFLSLLSTALVIACTFLACYVRKERKRNELNRFLLYSYK